MSNMAKGINVNSILPELVQLSHVTGIIHIFKVRIVPRTDIDYREVSRVARYTTTYEWTFQWHDYDMLCIHESADILLLPHNDYKVKLRFSARSSTFLLFNMIRQTPTWLCYDVFVLDKDRNIICSKTWAPTYVMESTHYSIEDFFSIKLSEPTISPNENYYITMRYNITYTRRIEYSPERSIDITSVKQENFWNEIIDKNGLTDPDVIFKCDEMSVRAHMSLLSAQSPVFKIMFQTEMVEKLTKVVEVKDLSYETLLAVIHFLYTGKVIANIAEMENLLHAAEKYDLKSLKLRCEKICADTLSVDNAVGTLHLALLYKAEELERMTLLFIKGHIDGVLQSGI